MMILPAAHLPPVVCTAAAGCAYRLSYRYLRRYDSDNLSHSQSNNINIVRLLSFSSFTANMTWLTLTSITIQTKQAEHYNKTSTRVKSTNQEFHAVS